LNCFLIVSIVIDTNYFDEINLFPVIRSETH